MNKETRLAKYKDLDAGKFLQAVGADGYKWAEAFMELWGHKLSEIDHGLMTSWFCNAIMAQYDKDRQAAEQKAVPGDGELVERIIHDVIMIDDPVKLRQELKAYISAIRQHNRAVPGDEELVEKVARVMCVADGQDPDEDNAIWHGWREYRGMAIPAIDTIRQHKPQGEIE